MKEADEAMDKTKETINEAHHSQTKLSVLLIHAQDHLMNAMTLKELAIEFIDFYKKTTENDN